MNEAQVQTERLRVWVTVGLIVGIFLAAVESTVVATAMPSLIADLRGQHLYSLPFALYLLLATVSGPVWGYASDTFGRRRLYLGAVGLFLVGSVLCGAAQSMLSLVWARALQGLGAGGVQTLTFTIIGELYPMDKRSQVQGFVSGVWGLTALVGPLIGGFIVDNLSWRWIFYLNLPFGLAAAALVSRSYLEPRYQKFIRPDVAGAAIFALGSGLLVYGLQTHRPLVALPGTIMLMFFPLLEARRSAPLVPLGALRHPLVGRAVLGNFLGGMAFFGITAYLPLFVQSARGEGATVAGILLSPASVGWTGASVLAARLLPRVGPRPLSMTGAASMAAGFCLWILSLDAPLWALGGAGLISGIGMGAVMLSLLVSAQEETPRETLGSVTATLLFARNVGGALGSAIMGALLGPALELGGREMGASFWRVPGLSALLSLIMLTILVRLPDLRTKRSVAGASG